MEKFITLLFEFEIYENGRSQDYAHLCSQALLNEKYLNKYLRIAKEKTDKYLDQGLYLFKYSVYKHKTVNFNIKTAVQLY